MKIYNKIYSGQASQWGDALISLRVSKYLREKYPHSLIYAGIAKKYSSILPLLKTAPYLDGVFIWEGCPSQGEKPFPTELDKLIIEVEKFDIFLDPYKANHRPDFYRHCHQVEDAFLRHDIEPPKDLQLYLPRPQGCPITTFEKDTVGFSPFANGGGGLKCLSKSKAQEIVDFLHKNGKLVIQLGGTGEYRLERAFQPNTSWLDTARILNSVELFITVDTACSWLASCYKTKTLGLYSSGYYSYAASSKNWQPWNPNAVYLEEREANNIPNEDIFNKIDFLLKNA